MGFTSVYIDKCTLIPKFFFSTPQKHRTWKEAMTNSTTRQITYFTFVRCFHKWKSMLFRRKKKIYHHTDSTAGGTKAEASNATTSIQPPQRETRWFPCLREMSQSPKSPNADHKPHTRLVLPPRLWLGPCPAPLHGSRHLLPSHPCSRHRWSKPSCACSWRRGHVPMARRELLPG